ncbi:MAG TPA: LacI family DNA-binding transcriptional regulator [Candidatus Methylacidiphilales bacterium]
MSKTPTIHDLAADLGISATTVWRAFKGSDRISDATRGRILARAKQIGYVPSLVAQNLSDGRTRTLGVVVPMVGHPVFSSLIGSIEEVAFERGYSIILCDTRLDVGREAEYARMLLSRRVEGVVVVPFAKRTEKWDDHLVALQKRNIPVVLLEQDLPTNRFAKVVADNLGAAYEVTRHLIGLGHRRIAFAFHPVHDWDPVGQERLAGFRKAMAEAGLAKKAVEILDAFAFEGEQVWRYQPERIAACFGRGDRPTALFAGMDMLAIQAMETLRSLGLRSPEDVAVAGFDDVEFSRFTHPPLTTVAQPTAAMGRRAAAILFDRIEGKPGARAKAPVERLPCRLIVRGSSVSQTTP